jgi:uncharacterized protein (TIGR02722 family)
MRNAYAKILFKLGGCAAGLAWVISGPGCSAPSAHYVDSNGNQLITNVGQINTQDWNNAAAELTQSLLASGVLDKAQHQPAVMVVSRIKNDTTQEVDIDLLVKNIRVALNKSGKVVTSTTQGLGGNVEDPMAQGNQEKQQFYSGTSNAPPQIPDFSLSGKLIEEDATAGNVSQTTFTFQLSLTDQNGNAVWEEQKQVTKQGGHDSVGF